MLGHHPVLEEVCYISQSARLALICLPGALSFVLDATALASESPQVSEDEVYGWKVRIKGTIGMRRTVAVFGCPCDRRARRTCNVCDARREG